MPYSVDRNARLKKSLILLERSRYPESAHSATNLADNSDNLLRGVDFVADLDVTGKKNNEMTIVG